jgi:1,2-phenylacetyl-CoA epoxidase PaaB subunit
MSKLRESLHEFDHDLAPEEGDLAPFVVFTQLKEDGPYLYAGWLDASDVEMAVQFAREHYGQDQECRHLCVIPRPAIAGTEPEHAPSAEVGPRRTWRVFTQAAAGDAHVSRGTVEAASGAEAHAAACAEHPDANSVWAVPEAAITATSDDDLIWRHTDQTYRLARGYSKDVRRKWEQIRADRDLKEYEKDDLKDAF